SLLLSQNVRTWSWYRTASLYQRFSSCHCSAEDSPCACTSGWDTIEPPVFASCNAYPRTFLPFRPAQHAAPVLILGRYRMAFTRKICPGKAHGSSFTKFLDPRHSYRASVSKSCTSYDSSARNLSCLVSTETHPDCTL